MAGDGLTIAVVGATGLVGKDLVTVLAHSPLPVGEQLLFASGTGAEMSIEVGDRTLPVHPLPAGPAALELFKKVDLVFFACPAEVTRLLGPQLSAEGVAVIDVGGALADRAPLVVANVGLDGFDRFGEERVVSTPGAPAVLLSTVLAPLLPLGARSVTATVILSAGAAGKDGIAELSEQVMALFNQRDPPRRVFPSGLAFDLVAQVGEATPSTAGAEQAWTGVERRTAIETAVILDLPPEQVAVTAVLVPLFAGVAAPILVEFDDVPTLDLARAALADAPSVRLGDPVPGPRRMVGRADVCVGRLRLDPAGRGLHLWAAADNVRFGATANAVAVAVALWKREML